MQLRGRQWDSGCLLMNLSPMHMVLNPTDDHHCIIIPAGSQDRDQLRIPLWIKEVSSYFPTWKPTIEEFEGTPLDNKILPLYPGNFTSHKIFAFLKCVGTVANLWAVPALSHKTLLR